MSDYAKRMDRAEVARRVELGTKLLQKGKTPEALDVYLQLLAADPENDAVRQTAADLCLSVQRLPEAVNLLGELFERQINSGDATRASLTYKKLARFSTPTWQQKARFAQLLESSNRRLALETYENSYEELSKRGDQANALVVLKRIVTLDPNEANLARLGELASSQRDPKTAAAAFLRLGQIAANSQADPAAWYERAYQEDSQDPAIAFAYGRSLLQQGQAGAAIFVLEPVVKASGPTARELREVYCGALLAASRLSEAAPFVWEQFEQNPSRVHDVGKLIGSLIDAQQDSEAVALARKLEQHQRRHGERRTFAAMMQDIAAAHRASPEVLEFMGELFNSSNRETDYARTLLKLFDLYSDMGNYSKAADCLDRAVEVDAYEPGHQKRLESLRGKIEDSRYKVIASRFTGVGKTTAEQPVRSGEPVVGAAALQDLMLQAEILVQYGMRSKALERVQRIQELFPREEERNEDLQRLYLAVGLSPRYPEPAATAAESLGAPVSSPKNAPPAAEHSDVSSLTRVAEITSKVFRQANADSVRSTVVNEIGAQWKISRCVIVLGRPGLAPTAVTDYCGEGAEPATPAALAQIASAVHEAAIARGNLSLSNAAAAPELESVRGLLGELNVASLLALPLSDGKDQRGLLLLLHQSPRVWYPSDVVALKAVSEQVVIALNNVGLRRLVKNLSVTDEKSGLLKRASYLDLLLGEARRALQQKSPLSVLLLQFGKGPALAKEIGEAAVGAMMEQISQLLGANIRQNDLAFLYDTATIALILGETGEAEGLLACEKLRTLLGQVSLPGKDEPVPLTAGVAEVVLQPHFDPVDSVTEVINRVEQALEAGLAQGLGKVAALAPAVAAAAVA
ncbi:MAG TPA: tetratricopeptide repeat protein [Terriglobales bacterium]|nr:tetratricopeptide repeat protein [Terriglobales bacterium]